MRVLVARHIDPIVRARLLVPARANPIYNSITAPPCQGRQIPSRQNLERSPARAYMLPNLLRLATWTVAITLLATLIRWMAIRAIVFWDSLSP
jgi:hypothetical protein